MSRLVVPDFGKKIDLILQSEKSRFKKSSDISKAINGISPDYFSRLKTGSRDITESVFVQVVALTGDTGLNRRDWFEKVDVFGKKLGLTRHQVDQILGVTSRGIDFGSRSKDESNIRSVYEVVGGYWESFYYSVSTYGEARISHDLVIIEEPEENGFMPCKVVDGTFVYQGYCFPIHGSFIYFMLEKAQLLDEIIVYLMNRPERPTNPVLDGVILCTSGGVEDQIAVPCSARVAFRYLGRTENEIKSNLPSFKRSRGQTVEEALSKTIPGYLDPTKITPQNARYWEVKTIIDNTIRSDAIPFAMRMERTKTPVAMSHVKSRRSVKSVPVPALKKKSSR